MALTLQPALNHEASHLTRGGQNASQIWPMTPSLVLSPRGYSEEYSTETQLEADRCALCGPDTGFLWGWAACAGSSGDGQQRPGFGRLMDKYNVDIAGGYEGFDNGEHLDEHLELDKVDVVLKLIDSSSGARSGGFFIRHGWELAPLGGDRYKVNGREVRLILLPSGRPVSDFRHLEQHVGWVTAKRSARIMVEDGPLRQPLLDYLLETGRNEQYDVRGIESHGAASHAGMLSFVVESQASTRGSGDDQKIGAMKQATLQAELRQRAKHGLPLGVARLQTANTAQFRTTPPRPFQTTI